MRSNFTHIRPPFHSIPIVLDPRSYEHMIQLVAFVNEKLCTTALDSSINCMGIYQIGEELIKTKIN